MKLAAAAVEPIENRTPAPAARVTVPVYPVWTVNDWQVSAPSTVRLPEVEARTTSSVAAGTPPDTQVALDDQLPPPTETV